MSPMSAPRRQRRGLARISVILDAATVVFARDGLERASTNAIASQAGISPGSLYQYFNNREEILAAVTARYLDGLRDLYAELLNQLGTPSSLDEVIDLIVDPVAQYKRNHAAFGLIYGGGTLPESAREAIQEAHSTFEERCVQALVARSPQVGEPTTRRGVRQCVALLRGCLPSLGTIHGNETEDLGELKRVMAAYLRSLGLN